MNFFWAETVEQSFYGIFYINKNKSIITKRLGSQQTENQPTPVFGNITIMWKLEIMLYPTGNQISLLLLCSKSSHFHAFSEIMFPGSITHRCLSEDFIISDHPDAPTAHNHHFHCNILRQRTESEKNLIIGRSTSMLSRNNSIPAVASKLAIPKKMSVGFLSGICTKGTVVIF